MPEKNKRCFFDQNGIAISLILAAVALLAIMGTLIAYSTRLGSQLSTHNADRADAMLLINQMSNIREGIKTMVARGVPIESITLDANDGTSASSGYSINTTGLYHPSLGGTEPQTPSKHAFDINYASYYGFHLITDASGNPMVKLYNVGTSAAERVVALVGLRANVCREINSILLDVSVSSSAALPTAASAMADWGSRPSATLIDLTGNTSMNQLEQCFQATGSSPSGNVYYAVIKAG